MRPRFLGQTGRAARLELLRRNLLDTGGLVDAWYGRRSVRPRPLTLLVDSHDPRSVFDPEGGRWVTFCDDHGLIINHERLTDARAFLRHPEQFCEDCHIERTAFENSANRLAERYFETNRHED